MNGNDENKPVQRAKFVGAPGPGPTQEQLRDMPSAQLPPPPAPGYSGPSDARLADLRAKYAQEFQGNPDLARKFMASTMAETEGLGKDYQQGYVEAVLNRAALRHQTLDQALSEDHDQWYVSPTGQRYKGYYAHHTIAQLGKQFPADQLSDFQGMIHNALQGSNMANYATGNESGDLNNGPTGLAAGDKDNNRLIIEQEEQPWWKTMTKSPPKAPLVKQPPQPPLEAPGTPLGSPNIVNPPQYQNPPIPPQTDTDSEDPAFFHWPKD